MRIERARFGFVTGAEAISDGGTAGAACRVPADTAARQAGLLVAALGLCLLLMLLPARGLAATLADLPGLAGLVVGNVAGLLAVRHATQSGSALLVFLAVPFLLISALPPACLLMAILFIPLEYGLSRLDSRATVVVRAVVALAGAAGIAVAVAGGAGFGTLAMLAAAWAPLASIAVRMGRGVAAGTAQDLASRENIHLRALLAAHAEGAARTVMIVDGAGTPDPAAIVSLPGGTLPDEGGSLIDRVLIADRVAMLRALSAAIYDQRSSAGLLIRMRREPAGAGFPSPPRYMEMSCDIRPVEGIFGKALVVISPREEGQDAGESIKAAPSAIPLSPVIHDCTAPFNAGLGFLEMIADPRLAPRDVATYRDFAAEARRALDEAHRNTILLGFWLRVAEEGHGSFQQIDPARCILDVVRLLNLRDAVDQDEIRLAEVSGGEASESLEARFAPHLTRLAIGALLRFGRLADRCQIGWAREGEDLIISCRREGIEAGATPDGFQQALEAVLTRSGLCVFGSDDEDRRFVRFTGACTGAKTSRDPVLPGGSIRLAS